MIILVRWGRLQPQLWSKKILSLVLICTALNACRNYLPDDPYLPPVMPVDLKPPPKQGGSIYQEGFGLRLYSDRIASRVGDILTIRLEESTKGAYKAKTKTQKNQQLSYPTPTVFGQSVIGLENQSNTSQIFDAKGDSDQSNSLSGTISVTVVRVLSNQNLVVQGETWVSINQGTETIQITGIVRPIDIEPNNMVSSQRIAGAQIKYGAKGQAGYATRMGLIYQFFNRFAPY